MAATVTSQEAIDTQAGVASESFLINQDVDATVLVTPTTIKAITRVELIPLDAAAAAATTTVAFDFGGATVTVTAANASHYQLTVFGKNA